MAVYSSEANFAGVSMVTATPGVNDPEVGTRLRYGDEDYIFVYNTGASQISTGFGAVVSAVTGYSVTVSSTTAADIAIGFCKHATIAAGSYGWLLTKGFGKVTDASGNGIAVAGMLTLADDGKVQIKTISTGFMGNAIGKAMGAIASAGSGDAYINCGI